MSCSVSLHMVLPPLRMCGIASIEVLVLSVQGVQALSTRFTQKNNVIKNVKGYIFALHTLHTCFFFVSAAKRPTFVRGLLSFVQGNPPVGPGAWGRSGARRKWSDVRVHVSCRLRTIKFSGERVNWPTPLCSIRTAHPLRRNCPPRAAHRRSRSWAGCPRSRHGWPGFQWHSAVRHHGLSRGESASGHQQPPCALW